VRNVFHRCGELTPDDYYTADADSLPDRNNLEHCLYTGYLQGGTVKDNVFYGCANRVWNVYPGTYDVTFENNILDAGNTAVRFDGSSSGNVVRYNVITNSQPVSANSSANLSANTVNDNATCANTSGSCGSAVVTQDGWTASNNVAVNPNYVDLAPKSGTGPDDSLSQTDYTIQDATALGTYQMGDGGTYAGGKGD
jgi:hypothetical protein